MSDDTMTEFFESRLGPGWRQLRYAVARTEPTRDTWARHIDPVIVTQWNECPEEVETWVDTFNQGDHEPYVYVLATQLTSIQLTEATT